MGERWACAILGADRSSIRYRFTRPEDAARRARPRELADQSRRFGCWRLHELVRVKA